ncbi:MAG: hypothetical protein ACD_75C01842G0001 [uncultured bacterium]|nr:MAG: hypothetical protein ACD_75C01842G0001 [uncultured bacterium]
MTVSLIGTSFFLMLLGRALSRKISFSWRSPGTSHSKIPG